MKILERIREHAALDGNRTAIESGTFRLSYRELDEYSDRVADYLAECGRNNRRNNRRNDRKNDRRPVAVYGHKSPYMAVCFLACVKAGHAYCPIDVSMPDDRVNMIIDMLDSPFVFKPEEPGIYGELNGKLNGNQEDGGDGNEKCNDNTGKREYITLEKLEKIIGAEPCHYDLNEIDGDDTFYIIFTSGSTGVPKGVEISCRCLENFLDWSCSLVPEKAGSSHVFLNQAPFSFDLSVMDMYTCFACGGTLKSLDRVTQGDYRKLVKFLGDSECSIWVSTPSFADLCLADRKFGSSLMPELERFIFCGEMLSERTVSRLRERFPDVSIINTYGPAECTVAVTGVEITDEMIGSEKNLPAGIAKSGTEIEIAGSDGCAAPDGAKGEIIIKGNTVGKGYLGRPNLTEKSFFIEEDGCGCSVRAYRTGDEGYMKNGMLYCTGRLDMQVKLHGYRIETGDIEQNIMKIEGVSGAVVVPSVKRGAVHSLKAFVVSGGKNVDVKGELRRMLPEYMIPSKIVFVDRIPVTPNGKADRKLLGGLKE